MHARLRALLLLALAAMPLAACAAETSTEETSEDDVRRRSYAFVDGNPEVPLTPVAKQKIQAALGVLAQKARDGTSPSKEIAAETLARIQAGHVVLGSIAGARGIDRWHMCKDYELAACKGAAPAPSDTTWFGDEALGTTLEKELAGYQWGNRVYFTIDAKLDPKELAATLVHEVNHVVNRSECSYYKDIDAHMVDDDRAFVEEFRAFFAECYQSSDAPSVETCSAHALTSTNTYGFRYDLGRILPEGPKTALALAQRIAKEEAGGGKLVPVHHGWPVSFVGCPAR